MDPKATIAKENSSIARSDRGPFVVSGVGVLLVLFVTLSLCATLQKSPTADENFHLVAGYSYLKWGDYRINPEHPPFAKLLAALPLLALEIDDSALPREQRDKVQVNGKYGWLLANQWLFSSNDAEKLFLYAKLPMLALGVILGLVVFCWTRELYGLNAGFAALAIYVLDPNILAHSSLVHTDIPFTLALFAGTYFFWRTLREINWFNWLMTIGFYSMSAVTKFSFVTILPIWVLLGISNIFSSRPLRPRIASNSDVTGYWSKAGWLAAILFSAVWFAYFAVWAVYGFRYEAVAGQRLPLGMGASVAPSPWLTPLIHFNVNYHVLPEAWLSGLVYALSTFDRTAYLLGEVSGEGFWLYFPIAFAVKTPLPTLLFLFVSLVFLVARGKFATDSKFLLVPIFLFFSLAVYSRMNIGLRHILPIYPFLFVWLGGTVGTLWSSQSTAKTWGVILLAFWLIWSSLKTYPDYLAYFNETLGSRAPHEILVDSNLDWGQDLKGLKRWMDDRSVRKIQLAYFGTADPAYYGIDAIHRPGTWSTVLSRSHNNDDTRTSLYIAISATHLVGIYLGPRNPYARFLLEKPIVTIGRSIHVYKAED